MRMFDSNLYARKLAAGALTIAFWYGSCALAFIQTLFPLVAYGPLDCPVKVVLLLRGSV